MEALSGGRKPTGLWGVVPSTIWLPGDLTLAVVDIDAYTDVDLTRCLEAVKAHLGMPLLAHTTSNSEVYPHKRHVWLAVRKDEAPGNAAFGAGELRGRAGYVCLWRPAEVAGMLAALDADGAEAPVPCRSGSVGGFPGGLAA